MPENYELFYWPNIPGRGEFVRLALEAAGVQYRDVAREDGIEAIVNSAGIFDVSFPNMPFAPPWLKAGDLMVFQTANICAFVGERHGLAPDDEQGRIYARGLALTLEDFAREIHDTHHPIGVSLYYEEQTDEAERRAEDFRINRLPVFLRFFDNVIGANPSAGGWLVGDSLGYCDLSLFQILEGLRYAFPNATARVERDWPNVVGLADQVRQHEVIAGYLTSDRRIPFNQDGLFRHYPALDAT